ncbi:MAG: hypothetical protein K8T26_04935 [Lentisphaerae bacterium]|nr:hypothetical protein [Lentisphaerota bacterium]
MARPDVRATFYTFGLPPPLAEAQPQGDWWLFNGMGTGHDGTIYSGLCDHRFLGDGARLIAFDPRTRAMRTVANMQDVCGQRGRLDVNPQSKIHTTILPDRDGRLYFGSHSCERDYAPPEVRAVQRGGFPGGHWLRYDPARGRCEDLGIALPGESLMGFAMDIKARRLYATTHTRCHLIEYNMDTGRTEIVGSVGKFPTRVCEVAADGCVYTFDEDGWVIRFDPRTRELRTLDARLPGHGPTVNFLTALVSTISADGRTIYGVTSAFWQTPREPMAESIQGRVMEFREPFAFAYDIGPGPDGRMRAVAPAGGVEGARVGDMHLLHSIARTREGDVLYVLPQQDGGASRLMRITAADGAGRERVLDAGGIVGPDGEGFLETALAGTTGLDGTVYFAGPRKSPRHLRDDTRWVLAAIPAGAWR